MTRSPFLPFAAVLAIAVDLVAQYQPQAIYPLAVDLLDATALNGPMTLGGTPPPAQPANGVCVNGVYLFNTNGQDARTPNIPTLNMNDFEFSVEFTVVALPPTFGAPVVMGGHLYRWLGFYVDPSGTFGIKHNNGSLAWSTATISPGAWHTAALKYENGNAEVLLDGSVVLQLAVGALNTGNNLNFTTNDFSNGRNHNGCIRNLVIANDTTLGPVAAATPYGIGCDGLGLAANSAPSIGSATFELLVTNVPPVLPFAYVAFGSAVLNPGIDLSAIGMPGCFGHTTFDLALVGPAVVIAGTTAQLSFPIPNDPTLTGTALATQAIAFTLATPLGLASSNGLHLLLAP